MAVPVRLRPRVPTFLLGITVMKFTIDPKFLTDVHYKTEIVMVDLEGNEHTGTISGSKDHPEFDQLRTLLNLSGYIRCETWWNGDTVLKPFSLNKKRFKVGDTFYCAVALKTMF